MTDSSEARLDEVRQFLADVENRWPSGREVVRLKRECGFLLSEVERLEDQNERLRMNNAAFARQEAELTGQIHRLQSR